MAKPANIKTKPTTSSVEEFIAAIPDEQKRKDSIALLQLMEKAAKEGPKMWGSSIIGFGELRYKSPTSGREVDWFKVGFSPRKANLTVYLVGDLQAHADALKNLGKHKVGGGCLYINKLADVNTKVLEEMIAATVKKRS